MKLVANWRNAITHIYKGSLSCVHMRRSDILKGGQQSLRHRASAELGPLNCSNGVSGVKNNDD